MKKENYTEKKQIVLKLTVGQEHELLSAQKIDDPDTLMYPAYQQAVRALSEIVNSAKRWRAKREAADCRSKDRNDLYGYANNTIVFCGSRGQGKTSAMLSFGNALACKTGSGEISGELDPARVIANNRFYVMEPIDPTMLKKGGHVSEIVLSYLYTQMKQHLSRGDCVEMSVQRKETLLRLFQQAFSWLHLSDRSSDRQDDFYDYEKLGHGFDIKENFYQLIEHFLMLKAGVYKDTDLPLGSGRRENHFLVVPLDDMDLQLQNSYNMLEEVRQYLQLPNTIVLMAADIDQLRNMTNMHYCQEMKPALENHLMNADAFRRLAAKYLDKLIPASQMIYLPEYGPSFRSGDEILVQIIDEKEEDPKPEQELHEHLFGLIYQKTGLVFVKHESYLNNLIPTTLRGLRQLYRLLNNLPTPCELSPLPDTMLNLSGAELEDSLKKENKIADANRVMKEYLMQRLRRVRQLEQNLAVFQSYFVGDWCASKLDGEGEKVLRTIWHSAIPNSFSAAIDALSAWCTACAPDYADALSSLCKSGSSYSTLCTLLDRLAERGTDKAFLLVFSVRTLFSIRFTDEVMQEQRRAIEKKLEDTARSDATDILRFGLDYNNLKGQFNKCLLDSAALQSILGDKAAQRCAGTAAELLKGYVDLLCFSKSDLPNTADLAQIWQYWTAQDWAVQICCNWELQDCVLKYINDHPTISTYTPVSEINKYLNALNAQLLQRQPLRGWGRDAQRKLIAESFASFVPKKRVFAPEVTSNAQHGLNTAPAMKLISDACVTVRQCLSAGPDKTALLLQDAASKLNNASALLKDYLSPSVSRQLEEMIYTLSVRTYIDPDVYQQMTSLRINIRNELRSLNSASPNLPDSAAKHDKK